MLRLLAAMAVLIVATIVNAQTNYTQVPAKAGETCRDYWKGCDDFCRTRASDPPSCNAQCAQQLNQCRNAGNWPIHSQQKVIIGLQP